MTTSTTMNSMNTMNTLTTMDTLTPLTTMNAIDIITMITTRASTTTTSMIANIKFFICDDSNQSRIYLHNHLFHWWWSRWIRLGKAHKVKDKRRSQICSSVAKLVGQIAIGNIGTFLQIRLDAYIFRESLNKVKHKHCSCSRRCCLCVGNVSRRETNLDVCPWKQPKNKVTDRLKSHDISDEWCWGSLC